MTMNDSHTILTVHVVDNDEGKIIKAIQSRITFLQGLLGCHACAICLGNACPNIGSKAGRGGDG